MNTHFLMGLLVGLVLAYALHKIFKGNMSNTQKGYIIIIAAICLYFIFYDVLGCRHGKYN